MATNTQDQDSSMTLKLILAWGFRRHPALLGRYANAYQLDEAVPVAAGPDAGATCRSRRKWRPLRFIAGRMKRSFVYGTVRETRRTAIYAIRLQEGVIDEAEAAEIAALMRDNLLRRGETATDVVVVQGGSKETLRLHGNSIRSTRVRTAMFNAAITWQPIELIGLIA